MEGLQVSQKTLVLGLFLVLFSASVFSAPLEITESDTSDFDGEITGGENLSVGVNFTNNFDQNLTFMTVLTISSDEVKVTGEEFDAVSANLNGMPAICDQYENVSQYEKSFACITGDLRVARPGSNNFKLVAQTSPYLYPAKYDLELDIRSVAGNSSPVLDQSTVDIPKGEFDIPLSGSSSISINASEDAKLMLMNYTELIVDYPEENSEHLESLMVDVFKGQPGDPEFGEVNASGSLNFSYPERLDEEDYSVGVYYYDDSDGSWENVTDIRNSVQNFVYANVSHFSTYAAFATPAEEDDTGGDGGEDGDGDDDEGGGLPPGFNPSPSEPDEEEPAENDTDENDSSQDQPENDQDETGNETDSDDRDQRQQQTGQEGSEDSDTSTGSEGGYWFGDEGLGNFFTGFASEGPGNVYVGLVALLVALVSVLQYTGRVDFVGKLSQYLR